MKLLPLIILIIISFNIFSQEKEFLIKGKIVGSNTNPISDVHIINYRNLQKIVSSSLGTFNIWVQPGDSLMISHIAFYRKKIYADSLKKQPFIYLIRDTVNIVEIDISPNKKTDYEKAINNIASIKKTKVYSFVKIKSETNPVSAIVTEHNKLMRSEASSVSLIRFSPGQLIGKLTKKIQRRKKSNQYKSTRKKK